MNGNYNCQKKETMNDHYKTECAVKSEPAQVTGRLYYDQVIFKEDELQNTEPEKNSKIGVLNNVAQIKQEVDQDEQDKDLKIFKDVTEDLQLKQEPTDQEENKDTEELYADHEVKEEMVLGAVVLLQSTPLQTNDAVLPKLPKVEIPDNQNEEEEMLAMVKAEKSEIETDLNFKSCLLTNSGSTVDALYDKNLKPNFKTESEPSDETSNLENKASGADVGLSSTPTAPRGSFEPDNTFIWNDCSKQFDNKTQLIQHIRSHTTTSNGFNCLECDYRTLFRDTLDKHLRLHDKTRPYECAECSYRFTQKSHLRQHWKIQHSVVDKETLKVHSCDVCVYKTICSNTFKEHLKTHTEEKQFSCSICKYKSSSKSKLKVHIRRHTGEKPFSCSVCTYTCAQRSNLIAHMRSHTGEKPFSCSVCTYSFAQKSHLISHMRSHTGEKPFSCSVCSYTCARKGDLNVHMRIHLISHMKIHTREKPFSCSLCDYTCARKSQLKAHVQVHTGEKPFSCDICGHKFSTKSCLNRHIKSHTGEKPFSCSTCTYKSSSKFELKRHMRHHTGEKPFSCSVCLYNFARKSDLKKHMLLHTGEEPFSCSICGRKFSQSNHFENHLRVHTGDKPFSCPVCTRTFSQKSNLKRHMNTFHTGQ